MCIYIYRYIHEYKYTHNMYIHSVYAGDVKLTISATDSFDKHALSSEFGSTGP